MQALASMRLTGGIMRLPAEPCCRPNGTLVSLRAHRRAGAAVGPSCRALGGSLGAPSPRHAQRRRQLGSRRVTTCAYDPLAALGNDFLLFLGSTVLVVPAFKAARQSPVLGYLFAGVVMGQLGLFRNMDEIEKLSNLGVLFLLFEMGLELSLDKLRSLAKYAFGLGSLQMLITSAAFMAVSLPPGEGLMTQLLERGFNAPPMLAEIGSLDEALVIAVALSLSSSAFVLQLLKERGELDSKFGQATLGILLYQDIATVPFLVLLPLIEGRAAGGMDGLDGAALLTQLGPTAAKTVGAIGLVLLGGRTFLRRVFEVVAAAKSSEVFIALCLLSVAGASLLTERLGFSDTLGAFVSGVLLSETNFKAQVEADIQPFRGLLLGLFFVTTGASLDLVLLIREWPTVLGLLLGLLALKASVISVVGPAVGLTRAESIRTGFVLSQGGEFAFVLLALAAQLNVLPTELNKLLIIVVVLSMAATPALTEAGKRVAEMVQARDGEELSRSSEELSVSDPVLVCGFGDVGQSVVNMLAVLSTPYVAFDLTVPRVQAAQAAGFNVLYGDGTRPKVLQASGVAAPRAIAVTYQARSRAVSAVSALRIAFPSTPILARAIDLAHASELQEAGATQVVSAEAEAGVAVGSRLALALGQPKGDVAALAQAMRDDMASRTSEWANRRGPSAARAVYAFNAKGALPAAIAAAKGPVPDRPKNAVFSSNGSGGSSGGSLLASIGQSILRSMGSMDSDDEQARAIMGSVAVAPPPAAAASHASMDGDADSSSENASTDLVTIPRGGRDVTLPDGSLECPVDFDVLDDLGSGQPVGSAAAGSGDNGDTASP